jgi:hypothetical protein
MSLETQRLLTSAEVAAGRLQQRAKGFNLKQPMLWLGFGMFFASRYSDHNYHVPITDLFLPILTGWMAIRERRLHHILSLPGFWLAAVFFLWFFLSNQINQVPWDLQIRHSVVTLTLFLPIFFYMLSSDKRLVMAFIVGNIIGFGVFFAVAVGLDYFHGSVDRTLRGIQPTPVVALALYLRYQKQLSRPLRAVLVLSATISFLVSISIEARGPFLSVIIALALWPLAMTRSMRTWALPAAVMLMFVAHYLLGSAIDVYDTIQDSHFATLSNLERGYAIDFSVANIHQNPWFGTSPLPFPADFARAFGVVHDFYRSYDAVESPHNSFLEYTLFFGFPAGLAFLASVWVLLRVGGRSPYVSAAVLALACSAIVRLAAFYGISGWVRIEWFTAMFILFYDFNPVFVRAAARAAFGRRDISANVRNS